MNADNIITYGINTLKRTWETGNKLGRLAVISILSWFIPLVSFAALQIKILSTAMVFMPIISAILLFSAYPVISSIVIVEPHTRKAAKFFAGLVGSQVLIGIYFILIPVSNAPNLVPVLVAAGIAYLLFKMSSVKNLVINSFLTLLMIAITFIFLMGGVSETRKSLVKATGGQTVEQRLTPDQSFTLRVNYSKSIKEILKTENYNNHQDIQKNFANKKMESAVINVHVVSTKDLFGVERSTSPDELKKSLEKSGFRFAKLRELIKLGKLYFHNKQNKETILTLSEYASSAMKKNIAGFISNDKKGKLFGLDYLPNKLTSGYKYAIVSKEITETKKAISDKNKTKPKTEINSKEIFYSAGFFITEIIKGLWPLFVFVILLHILGHFV